MLYKLSCPRITSTAILYAILLAAGSFFLLSSTPPEPPKDVSGIRSRIESFKNDVRGPYRDIRWFCKDGTTLPPEERCQEKGAVQRARMKDDALALADRYHLYLGQILSTTENEDFWDANYNHSRIKQYQMGKYLQSVDDGWVLRKGQFYRGAFQVEDEEAWGIEFYKWLLQNKNRLEEQFYFVRQTARDIPHRTDDAKTWRIRAISKTLSEEITDFMDLRVKIHGQPEYADIARVVAFRDARSGKLSEKQAEDFEKLITDMRDVYSTRDLLYLCPKLDALPGNHPAKAQLMELVDNYDLYTNAMQRSIALSDNMLLIREHILNTTSTTARLNLLDMSLQFEELLIAEMTAWKPKTIEDQLDKICYASQAAMGAGLIEGWEWEHIQPLLSYRPEDKLSLIHLRQFFETGRDVLEWGTGLVHATYGDVTQFYTSFEPLAGQFIDDRIRSSVLLPLGESVSSLGNVVSGEFKSSNAVLNISDQDLIRGLNAGYAKGELVVVAGNADDVEVSSDKIYVFQKPPADLKPVAGIATVSEGNLISHIQLLARNLGIPNMVLAQKNLEALKKFNGTEIFYAVSPNGNVIIKKATDMTAEEEELFKEKTRKEEKLTVPVDKLLLDQKSVLNLRSVNASHSGKLCGPKAANLGQLKSIFPDHVVEGLVIPFGIFREHMDQNMPGQSTSYWGFVQNTFKSAEEMRAAGKSNAEIETYTLGQLATLQKAIKSIKFTPSFLADLSSSFQKILGKDLGKIPVFVRSDTNMEDLKDFTGAGLNLTVFNVVDREKILQGIRDVWASPYSERSYKWRQAYLLNPENVFPSILIIPSVDVECSGVMVTKGIETGRDDDNTVAFNRGAGGAVDGQAAETYIIQSNGRYRLMAPAREVTYRVLPATGGTETKTTSFEKPILSRRQLMALREMAGEMRAKLPGTPGVESTGPFDIELGFTGDKLWLFQVRPFVENKNAKGSAYLESITSRIPPNATVRLDKKV